jgi:hypothetical protein
MLGSAVSSSTPKDFHPNSHIGYWGSRALMNRHALLGRFAVRVTVSRGGNAQGVGVGNGSAKKGRPVHQ